MKKVLFTLIISMFFMVNVHAATCSTSVKNAAKKVTVKYSVVGTSTSGSQYKMTVSNLTSSLTAKYYGCTEITTSFTKNNNTKYIIGNSAVCKTAVEVFSSNCGTTILKVIHLTMPQTNPYYNSSVCDGLSNYKYCSSSFDTSVSSTELRSNIKKLRTDVLKKDTSDETLDNIEEAPDT